jgi:glucose-1-phosphate thymidylyltransferase
MKGVLLAGGAGSRLWPVTNVVSKQLLPVYDKPMVYYPLCTLMLAGIRELLLISTPVDLPRFKTLLGDGHKWGLSIDFAEQDEPKGIADALIVAERFIGDERSALILGDNIFHGPGLGVSLAAKGGGLDAEVFAYEVADPRQYAVVTVDKDGRAIALEEKPAVPATRLAVPGLYFYPPGVSQVARSISPSARGELEITDVNLVYLREGRLSVTELPRGTAWLDTGTHASLSDASNYVRVLEERQGAKISCPEEISWRQRWISDRQLESLAQDIPISGYRDYLLGLVH